MPPAIPSQPLTESDILAILRKNGIAPGDIVLVHSSFKTIGEVIGTVDAVIDALIESVGPEGHLAMPTFTYGPRPEPVFDPSLERSLTGILTELFRKRPGVVRSLHPTHSVAILGPRAEEFAAGHLQSGACGIGSPVDRLAQAGGKVLLLGVTQQANTTIHVGETRAGIVKFPLWEDAAPVVPVRLPDGSSTPCTLDATNSCSAAFNGLESFLRINGCIRDFKVGQALTQLMSARDVMQAVATCHRAYPDLLFCTQANCVRCRKGRAYAIKHPPIMKDNSAFDTKNE